MSACLDLHVDADCATQDCAEEVANAARAAAQAERRRLATGASAELRALLLNLHDAVLEQRGLVAALEEHGALVRQRSGLRVELPDSASARSRARGCPRRTRRRCIAWCRRPWPT